MTLSSFKKNENTFDSCFIFDEMVEPGEKMRRYKVYNKFIQLLMSKSAASGLGMNTQKIFTLSNVMTNVIKECSMHGMTRIEISYILDSPKAVAEVFSGSFLDDFKHDLDIL